MEQGFRRGGMSQGSVPRALWWGVVATCGGNQVQDGHIVQGRRNQRQHLIPTSSLHVRKEAQSINVFPKDSFPNPAHMDLYSGVLRNSLQCSGCPPGPRESNISWTHEPVFTSWGNAMWPSETCYVAEEDAGICGQKLSVWLMRVLASVGRLRGKLAADPDFEDLVRKSGVSVCAGVSSFFCSASLLSLGLEYSTSWCSTTREPTLHVHVWGCYPRIFAAFS